jgi:protein SCO1/2
VSTPAWLDNMKGKQSFFIAIAVIVVPILIYFLMNAGKQNYKRLPVFGEKVAPNGADIKDTIFYTIPDFKVTSQTGQTVTQQTFNNSIYIANFFFASCKDVCPIMNAKVETVYEKAKEYAEVKFISFSVDPENDSVPVLAAYAKKFHADPNIWYFVTGSEEDIFKAGQGFLLPVSIENKTVDHSQQLLLIDKQNRIRGIYDGLDDLEIKRLNEDLKVLLYEYHHTN